MTPVTDAFLAGANLDTIACLMQCDIRQAQVVLRSELHRLAAISADAVAAPIDVVVLTSKPTRKPRDPRNHKAELKASVKAKLDAPKPEPVRKPRASKSDEPKICAGSPEMAMYPPSIRETRAITRRAIWDALRTGPLSLAALAQATRVTEGAALITVKKMLLMGLTERTSETPYRWARKSQVAEPADE